MLLFQTTFLKKYCNPLLHSSILHAGFWIGGAAAFELHVYSASSIQLEAFGDVQVVHLDRAQQIEVKLEENLPTDPERAAVIVRHRLEQGGPDLQHEIDRAYQGITDAWQQGITRLPAVVVDRRYVVYGEPNVQRALQTIEAFRSSER
ncbi:TIGR03757 family integrating conjugative element protein [Pseudomonas sp. TNT2022 ID357]|uniref:TIGR03757 family integrating conjugative element protein n=1 Tax=Pseudomonas idahonensis TaxID=2942628 RepID=A0ABT5Q3R7_9PSED|nr:TIGR03757 family integrating conjugative element protein [Pseudomonas idahonensis]MDD1148834.1 TIGR03757 family integrating conjugative element protein [Pseudomonas idahonensis]